MFQVLIAVHVLIALAIIGLVMLQQGRGADAGAGFGGGASGTLFGARGSASFLTRTTAILAATFFATSLLLAYLGGKQDNAKSDLMDAPATSQAPADLPVVKEEPSMATQPDLPLAPEESKPSR
jgi:preprotein translocase subunit SecG